MTNLMTSALAGLFTLVYATLFYLTLFLIHVCTGIFNFLDHKLAAHASRSGFSFLGSSSASSVIMSTKSGSTFDMAKFWDPVKLCSGLSAPGTGPVVALFKPPAASSFLPFVCLDASAPFAALPGGEDSTDMEISGTYVAYLALTGRAVLSAATVGLTAGAAVYIYSMLWSKMRAVRCKQIEGPSADDVALGMWTRFPSLAAFRLNIRGHISRTAVPALPARDASASALLDAAELVNMYAVAGDATDVAELHNTVRLCLDHEAGAFDKRLLRAMMTPLPGDCSMAALDAEAANTFLRGVFSRLSGQASEVEQQLEMKTTPVSEVSAPLDFEEPISTATSEPESSSEPVPERNDPITPHSKLSSATYSPSPPSTAGPSTPFSLFSRPAIVTSSPPASSTPTKVLNPRAPAFTSKIDALLADIPDFVPASYIAPKPKLTLDLVNSHIRAASASTTATLATTYPSFNVHANVRPTAPRFQPALRYASTASLPPKPVAATVALATVGPAQNARRRPGFVSLSMGGEAQRLAHAPFFASIGKGKKAAAVVAAGPSTFVAAAR